MENNNSKVSFQTRSHADRRRVRNRRLFFNQEYLDHNPERRSTGNERRMHGDRRDWISEIEGTFWREDHYFYI